jgi:hypothetical protein
MNVAMDDRTLRRTIALLVSLAVLAERAAARSFPVRWFVLALLRHAETVALGFAAEATRVDWVRFEEDDREAGYGPIAAAVLAGRFRALAALLGTLLAPPDGRDGRTRGRSAAPCLAPGAHARFVTPAWRPPVSPRAGCPP